MSTKRKPTVAQTAAIDGNQIAHLIGMDANAAIRAELLDKAANVMFTKRRGRTGQQTADNIKMVR